MTAEQINKRYLGKVFRHSGQQYTWKITKVDEESLYVISSDGRDCHDPLSRFKPNNSGSYMFIDDVFTRRVERMVSV